MKHYVNADEWRAARPGDAIRSYPKLAPGLVAVDDMYGSPGEYDPETARELRAYHRATKGLMVRKVSVGELFGL